MGAVGGIGLGTRLLDWASLSVSLLNTILLLWLGLTVLLNAERRTWGLWLAGGGLLTGGAFFILHSAILGMGYTSFSHGLDVAWRLAWLPVIALPYAWYIVMLWYAGYWDDAQSPLRRRQRPWLLITGIMATAWACMLTITNSLPSLDERVQDPSVSALSGVPAPVLAYPIYLVLCITLALDVVLRPGPSMRVMGPAARRRAQPWLVAASVVLLVVSMFVAWATLWITATKQVRGLAVSLSAITSRLTVFDLIIASLIALAVLLIGQATVSYEVFTGRMLPSGGLRRQWQRTILIGGLYSVLISAAFSLPVLPITWLLIATCALTASLALYGRLASVERERIMHSLRPFVASDRLYDHLLAKPPASPADVEIRTPFRTLCADVLGARLAYLMAFGPLASFAGAPLSYPEDAELPASARARVPSISVDANKVCEALDPVAFGGALWAVSLWSERGRIGVLLLGDKADGGFYTQEEMEIARAISERLIDTKASAELTRRLVSLQRQRLTESQVLDRRARRVLHDQVLPQLHAAMLSLPAAPGDGEGSSLELLAGVHRLLSDLLHDMPLRTTPAIADLGLIQALRQTVESEFVEDFDSVSWEAQPEPELTGHAIPPLTAEVVFYAAREAIRNAARHGRGEDPARPLHLRIEANWQDGLKLLIEDSGVGLRDDTWGEFEGGHGLALHSAMMAIVGGSLEVEAAPGEHTRVWLHLPKGTW